jgi:exopolysaccharide production protein ExoZ
MIWSIQVLRFAAALMVVYIHAVQIAATTPAAGSIGFIPFRVATIGHIGVDIFFVISGLIIAKIALGRTPSEFMWSRIIRIVPMYLLFTIPALAINIAITGFGWRDAVATFLLWPATDQITIPALEVGWTLCFEMLFYACAALVLVDRRWVFAIIAAYGIALILRPIGPLFQFIGNLMILEFLLGVAIAYAPNWRWAIWGIPFGTIWLVGAGLIGIQPATNSMDLLLGHDALQRVLIFGVPSAMIVYGALQIKARKSVWTYLGDASYSLYLSHSLILLPLLSLWTLFPMPPYLIIPTGISASLIFAWRVHERFEKPILALFKRQQLHGRQSYCSVNGEVVLTHDGADWSSRRFRDVCTASNLPSTTDVAGTSTLPVNPGVCGPNPSP